METCRALLPWSSISTCLSVPRCASLPKKYCSPERAQISACQADGPIPPYNFNFRSKSGVHHPDISSKYRQKSLHVLQAAFSPWTQLWSHHLSSANQHRVIQSKRPAWNPHTNLCNKVLSKPSFCQDWFYSTLTGSRDCHLYPLSTNIHHLHYFVNLTCRFNSFILGVFWRQSLKVKFLLLAHGRLEWFPLHANPVSGILKHVMVTKCQPTTSVCHRKVLCLALDTEQQGEKYLK